MPLGKPSRVTFFFLLSMKKGMWGINLPPDTALYHEQTAQWPSSLPAQLSGTHRSRQHPPSLRSSPLIGDTSVYESLPAVALHNSKMAALWHGQVFSIIPHLCLSPHGWVTEPWHTEESDCILICSAPEKGRRSRHSRQEQNSCLRGVRQIRTVRFQPISRSRNTYFLNNYVSPCEQQMSVS